MYRLASIILLFCLLLPVEAAHVKVAWDNPTTNTDGSSLTNMAGNIVCYGPRENKYENIIDVGLTNQVVLWMIWSFEANCDVQISGLRV